MFTTIAHYIDPIEAHLARGRLLSEGIDAHLGDEHLAVANWEWRLAVGGVKLRVADGDVGRAKLVLQALDAGEYALESESDDESALHAPDRESWSSRLAWLALMLFGIPLPWRRRAASDEVVRKL
jgi:Putative prokaryotic signal transducing protein